MKTLVIYFSQKGKTKEAAGRIAQLSGADLAEIKTHKSYRMSYRKTVFTALKEILLNERPEVDRRNGQLTQNGGWPPRTAD